MIKYGIKISRNVKEACKFDDDEGNIILAVAIYVEIDSLIPLKYFEFMTQVSNPPKIIPTRRPERVF